MLEIVIPAKGDLHRLELALSAFRHQTVQRFRIILVDSGEDSRPMRELAHTYQKQGTPIRYIHFPIEGFNAGKARNLGARQCTSDRILFMDADCYPNRDVVGLHAYYGARKTIVAGHRLHVPESMVPGLTTDRYLAQQVPLGRCTPDKRFRVGADEFTRARWAEVYRMLIGAAVPKFCFTHLVSYPTDVFKTVGGFWEEMTWGAEDTELATRVCRAGCGSLLHSAAFVWHLDHPKRCQPEEHQRNQQRYLQTLNDASIIVRNGGPLR